MHLDPGYIEKLEKAREHLKQKSVPFAAGLTDREAALVEEQFGFVFPPDLRWFLQQSMPVGNRFPNWRGDRRAILERLNWPAEGICFDIRNNVFWWPDWGERPSNMEEAIAIALQHLESVPKLIPIFGHSYLPSRPHLSENPVFSVHQADIIHFGANLAEFFLGIFRDEDDDDWEDRYPVFSSEYRWIEFWSALTEWNVGC